MKVDTAGIELTKHEEAEYRRLFEWLPRVARVDKLKGNVILPFDGEGGYGRIKVQRFIDVAREPMPAKGLRTGERLVLCVAERSVQVAESANFGKGRRSPNEA